MKFGKFLSFGIHPEWKDYYIPYKELKTHIKLAGQRVKDRTPAPASDQAPAQRRSKGPLHNRMWKWVKSFSQRDVNTADLKQPLLAVNEEKDSPSQRQSPSDESPVLSAGGGYVLVGADDRGAHIQAQAQAQGAASQTESDGTSPPNNDTVTSDASAEVEEEMSVSLQGPPGMSLPEARLYFQGKASREQYARAEARLFMELLDRAVDKCNRFYLHRESALAQMLEDVIRTAYRAFHRDDPLVAKPFKSQQSQQQQQQSKDSDPDSEEGIRQRRGQERDGARPRVESTWTRTTDVKRLRKNFLTIYKMIANLRTFATLNYTAVRKISKKFDKAVDIDPPMADRYLDRIPEIDFCSSTRLDELTTKCEENYAEFFANGDVKTAVVDLQKSDQHVPFYDALTLGVSMGVVLSLIFAMYVVDSVSTDHDHEQSLAVLPVLRAAFCFTLMVWCWGILVYTFDKNNINHVYLFDFNPQDSLRFYQIIKLAAVLSAILVLSSFLFWSAVHRSDGTVMGLPARVWMMSALLLFLVFLVNPFDYCNRSSRQTLGKRILQVMASPFSSVRFVHVYVGDVITSMVHPIADVEYTICFYASGEFRQDNPSLTTCNNVKKVVLPIVSALPYIWRGMQCLRRYYDTGDAHPHLTNAGKYMSGVLVTVLGLVYADFVSGSDWDAGRIVWMCFFVGEVLYMYTWDVFMDWGFRPFSNPKTPLLRDTLLYRRTWCYYFAIVSNFFMRWAWALTITPVQFMTNKAYSEYIIFGLSVCEILRRFQWSFIRVEYEYIGNQEKLRSMTAIVPLGPRYRGGNVFAPGGGSGSNPFPNIMATPSLAKYKGLDRSRRSQMRGVAKAGSTRVVGFTARDKHDSDSDEERGGVHIEVSPRASVRSTQSQAQTQAQTSARTVVYSVHDPAKRSRQPVTQYATPQEDSRPPSPNYFYSAALSETSTSPRSMSAQSTPQLHRSNSAGRTGANAAAYPANNSPSPGMPQWGGTGPAPLSLGAAAFASVDRPRNISAPPPVTSEAPSQNALYYGPHASQQPQQQQQQHLSSGEGRDFHPINSFGTEAYHTAPHIDSTDNVFPESGRVSAASDRSADASLGSSVPRKSSLKMRPSPEIEADRAAAPSAQGVGRDLFGVRFAAAAASSTSPSLLPVPAPDAPTASLQSSPDPVHGERHERADDHLDDRGVEQGPQEEQDEELDVEVDDGISTGESSDSN